MELYPQALANFGRVWFIAWSLRRLILGECRRGIMYFLSRHAYLGYGPASSSHVKRALCQTLVSWDVDQMPLVLIPLCLGYSLVPGLVPYFGLVGCSSNTLVGVPNCILSVTKSLLFYMCIDLASFTTQHLATKIRILSAASI